MNSELDDPHTLHLKVHIDDPHVPEDHKSPAGPALRFPGPGAKLKIGAILGVDCEIVNY